jgi:hypothetical protein
MHSWNEGTEYLRDMPMFPKEQGGRRMVQRHTAEPAG